MKEIRDQNPKKAMDSTPTKKKPTESSGQKESGEKRSNSVVKKIKIKRKDSRDRIASGRQGVKSSQQTGSPEKRVSPGGTVYTIPVSRIKYEQKPDLFNAKPGEDAADSTLPGSSSGFVNSKRIKLSKKSSLPLGSNVVEEPRIIDTTKPSAFRSRSPSPAKKKPAESENLYGLDISILKSLNMDHLLEEK